MGLSDQEAMTQKMLVEPFRNYVRCIAGKRMNANLYEYHGLDTMAHRYEVNAYEPGDWILHLAGIESSLRMALLTEYAKRTT